VRHALQGLTAEVWVVDNASNDGSVAYLQPLFPEVKWIDSKENLGFAKANNLALQQAKGEFILYLNPDTLIPENCLHTCLSFFKATPDAGAIGIRMVDGSGTFLPESKRAFPSPLTSFYKLIGLSTLFPTSPIFARYQLGHLSSTKTHVVDVLAGAFMMIRRKVVEKTGGFDERYFMYGEDIDLSYRIQKTMMPDGKSYWQNYFFAGSTIIHFKGESTKKGSLNYVMLFYKAMVQFVKKHYSSGNAGLFSILLYPAIFIRGFFSLVQGIFQRSLALLKWRKDVKEIIENRKILVAGTQQDFEAIKNLLSKYNPQLKLFGRLSLNNDNNENALMPLEQWLHNRNRLFADEIIFCIEEKLCMQQVIPLLSKEKELNYKFHYAGSSSIVGSNNSNFTGESISA